MFETKLSFSLHDFLPLDDVIPGVSFALHVILLDPECLNVFSSLIVPRIFTTLLLLQGLNKVEEPLQANVTFEAAFFVVIFCWYNYRRLCKRHKVISWRKTRPTPDLHHAYT